MDSRLMHGKGESGSLILDQEFWFVSNEQAEEDCANDGRQRRRGASKGVRDKSGCFFS